MYYKETLAWLQEHPISGFVNKTGDAISSICIANLEQGAQIAACLLHGAVNMKIAAHQTTVAQWRETFQQADSGAADVPATVRVPDANGVPFILLKNVPTQAATQPRAARKPAANGNWKSGLSASTQQARL